MPLISFPYENQIFKQLFGLFWLTYDIINNNNNKNCRPYLIN